MKTIKISNYIVDNEQKVNKDILEFKYNESRWGMDFDVIRAWIDDECFNMFGVFLKSFEFV